VHCARKRARSTTYPSYAAKRLGRSRPKLVQTLIWTMGRSYGGRRSRVCIDAHAERSNVRTEPHIQHRRPTGWADRGPHWYKHLLGQWAEVMGVGDRQWSLMCAQTCAQHHLSSIGARRSGPIEPPNWYKNSLGKWPQVTGVENGCEAREYRNGTYFALAAVAMPIPSLYSRPSRSFSRSHGTAAPPRLRAARARRPS
jgi:hypothetical protein